MLLDNFIRSVTEEGAKALEEAEESRMKALGVSHADGRHPLEPLLASLSRFRSSGDLARRITTLFRVRISIPPH